MSIYIKGMDMPKDCGECFVGNRTICSKQCPLVEVKEPHGRLIDADVLIENIENKFFAKIIEEYVTRDATIIERSDK